MQGEWYTWHNCSTTTRSLWKRLDRMLINDRWLERFPTSSYHSLTPRTSDHSPLVLYGDTQQHNGGMFRFDNYLALSPDFIPSVQNIWQHEIMGVPIYVVTRKLKALKSIFQLQRRNKGDLFFQCRFSRRCLTEIRRTIRFLWPNREWKDDITWASQRWRGKHIINMSYRALLAACVYHNWKERNLRRFDHTERTPTTIALLIIEDIRPHP
ncbi:UNVERIFIED_CONTAM: hypothetical protein Sindi_3025100 [Sesamum indicum]